MLLLVSSVPRAYSALIAIFGIVVVGTVDFFTGFDVSLSVFYAVVVIFAVWSLGRVAGTAVAALAVATWTLADHYSGHTFATHWILLWNAVVRFCFFMLVVVGSYHSKRHLEQTKARAEALERVLPICNCCKKISDEHGAWVGIETFLAETLSSRPALKLCPDCSRKLYIDKVSPGSAVAANS